MSDAPWCECSYSLTSSSISNIRSGIALCNSYIRGLGNISPRAILSYLCLKKTQTKNHHRKPLGRKAAFSFYGRDFDLVINRRGSSRSSGLCLQQRYHLALTMSHCVLQYFISCGAISVLWWEFCFTHGTAKRKKWIASCGRWKASRAPGSNPSFLLELYHGVVETLHFWSSLPLSANPAWLLPKSARCLGNQPFSGFS